MSNASNPNHLERNKALKLSTHGVIFCGVPHQGGNNVPEAKILLQIGSVLTNTTTNIVRILEPGNEVLRTQRDSFTYISNDFFTVNLVETENTPVKVGTRLVSLSPVISLRFSHEKVSSSNPVLDSSTRLRGASWIDRPQILGPYWSQWQKPYNAGPVFFLPGSWIPDIVRTDTSYGKRGVSGC